MLIALALLFCGLVALLVGGELLVRGAVALALRADVSPLVVGLVIVGFGTSMPELVTSVEAAFAGAPGIAWGNIAGSNIANSLLILGAAAAVSPIALGRATPLRDPTVAAVAGAGLLIVAVWGWANQTIAIVALGALGLYILACYFYERKQPPTGDVFDDVLEQLPRGWTTPMLQTLAGLGILIAGGQLLVTGAVDLARLAGLSETMIGLTIVAIGTSLPELVTSVVAARRGHSAVAFGNVVGSNIYNILGIGGVTMLLSPSSLPTELIVRDLPIMVVSMVLILIMAWRFSQIRRSVAVVMLLSYGLYLTVVALGH